MLKISKLLDYGLLIVVTIAKNDSSPYSAAKTAEITGLNIPTVRKLLNLLSLANIVASKRGVDGGYVLVKNPREISVLEIVKAVENDVSITECCDMQKSCSVLKKCTVHNYWKIMNNKVLDILSNTSIYDIVNHME
ncbi:SUF system Fe-S cluster assembly regulator [Allofrancisella guangzhouensis]|uniref:Transcriptional regulator n=1 Tax=Allofrancisella guangzhouensis TaxID=594679 RepID=A0A0A8E6B4_9GAMM|nr:SUF system Fe-S cluster assembly regulator [Allofrancisella guangzhouensis]AJC49102.1 transcriptional regulator [Allofrancisella guangzhouensis]MBK2026816.1 SUF system Fe-S cluster assembly regulator [Allofrancisella guangzhouensis]MBK2043565.1 SUF system Fe-S cluster assembly regulator [Allofrancisella guangzhouensis]MBK2046313.1 SUF system Fe-S cluster assembly regulator [Allofrancisella guangzhouensis]